VSADTAPIRPEERFDEQRVAAYLAEHLPELLGGGPITFEQFPGGKANLTYLARCGDTEVVLRRPPLGPVAPGSHDMEREHTVLSVLHEAFPKAPRSYHLCTDSDVMGKPFFVMERRKGTVVRERWPSSLPDTPAFRRRVAEGLVDTLGELHAVDFVPLGLGSLGRPSGFVARQVEGWSDRWDKAKEDDVPDMSRLAERLAGSVPVPQAATLLHNDFKLDNTMIASDGSIEAVFDWDMSTTGDPLVDLGTTLAYWASADDAIFPLFAAETVMLHDAMGRDEIVERYGAASDLDVSGVGWYQALACFRIAVILQQIYIRYRRGQTTDERFAALGSLVPPIATDGLRLL
jgi:aminoglycoside phosphotransferase (APT) family kinase protein